MNNPNVIANRVTRPPLAKLSLEDRITQELTKAQKTKILTEYAQTISSQRRSRSLIAIVLNAAIDLINSPDGDLIGMNLAQLAKHTGTTRSGIYRYFADMPSIIYHALKKLLDSGMTRDQFTSRELCVMAYYGLIPFEEEKKAKEEATA